MPRLTQESKDKADVGWLLEYGIPAEWVVSNERIYARYGNMIVDLEAVSDGITFEKFKNKIQEKELKK